jgi:hypothetical protein
MAQSGSWDDRAAVLRGLAALSRQHHQSRSLLCELVIEQNLASRLSSAHPFSRSSSVINKNPLGKKTSRAERSLGSLARRFARGERRVASWAMTPPTSVERGEPRRPDEAETDGGDGNPFTSRCSPYLVPRPTEPVARGQRRGLDEAGSRVNRRDEEPE